MLVKVCRNCNGTPYTRIMSKSHCPVCGSKLYTSSVTEDTIEDSFEMFFDDDNDNTGDTRMEEEYSTENDYSYREYDEEDNQYSGYGFEDNPEPDIPARSIGGTVRVCGKVSQYSVNSVANGYHRIWLTKLIHLLLYRQRLEDCEHKFIVNSGGGYDGNGMSGYASHMVSVHGTIGYGATLTNNEIVEVEGKYNKDHILMASRVSVLTNGHRSRVRFQRSVKGTFLCILMCLILLVGMVSIMNSGSVNSMSSFFNTLGSFCGTVLVVYAVLLILYVFAQFTRIGFMARMFMGNRKGGSPLLSLLVVSFILALILYNAFGIGTFISSALSGVLAVVGPIVIIFVGIALIFKSMFR